MGTSRWLSSTHGVVDAHAAERGQQVLDRLDRGLAVDQARLESCCSPEEHVGWDLHPAEVRPAEPDTGVRRRRNERDLDLLTGMDADSSAVDRATKGALRRNLVPAAHPLARDLPLHQRGTDDAS